LNPYDGICMIINPLDNKVFKFDLSFILGSLGNFGSGCMDDDEMREFVE